VIDEHTTTLETREPGTDGPFIRDLPPARISQVCGRACRWETDCPLEPANTET
jgi:hypothetical protein